MEIAVIISAVVVVAGIAAWLISKNRKQKTPESVIQEPEKPVVIEKPVVAEPEPKVEYNTNFEEYLSVFYDYIQISRDTVTYNYMYELFREAEAQFYNGKSVHSLPILHKEENFPSLYKFGNDGLAAMAGDTLIGWVLALQMAELKPYNRADILKIGYEMGNYDKYSNIYGYEFDYDPNLLRILGGAIYAAMRGHLQAPVDTMRKECGDYKYSKTLKELSNDSRDNVADEAFFTDFRKFMPTAPAPYAPGYTNRPDRTYPNEGRDDYDNLEIDRQIHEMIVENYNLDQSEHYQECVQAIADKEGDKQHLFGKNRSTEHYHFHPVFGKDTIGVELSDSGNLADFVSLVFSASSASREILQSATVNPKQYGRLRPGCSWEAEGKKNSDTDDKKNVLVDFEIEDGDGSPTGYYDENGNWVYMNGISSPEEFNEKSKNQLYANSYPSGHSAGIIGAAMVLMELMPNKADVILKTANQYAVNRTISRYHWTSDTINGRVLGTATNAVSHAASDFDDLLNKARKEL